MAKKYPDSFDSNVPSEVVYTGKYMPLDPSGKMGLQLVSCFCLNSYLFAIVEVAFDEYAFALDGVIHCTGGAQTKVLHFIEG